MPKRKRKAPTQLNPAKRWLLTWNMNDGNQGASTSCSAVPPIVHVDDMESTVESGLSLFSPTSSTHTDGGLVESTVEETICLAPPTHITKAEYNTLWERASYSITLNEQTPQDTTLCQLGQITLILKPHGSSKIRDPFPETLSGSPLREETLPKQFPRGRCSLFICAPRPHYLVFDYTMGNAENVPSGYSPSVFMCLVAKILHEPEDVCLDSLQLVCHQHKAKLKLIHHGYNYKTGHLSLSVCISHQGILSPAFAAEFVRGADVYSHHVQRIMHWFHGYPPPAPLLQPVTSKRHDFNKLFDAIRLRHAQNGDDSIVLDVRLQSPCLVPTLREYQRQAVAWMLQKEGFGQKRQEEEEAEESAEGKLHCLWSKVRLGEETLYYNVHSGQFTKQRFTQKPSFPGGILADEMGLGKTVEVLACILAHPRYPSTILDSNNDTAENPSSDFDTVMGTNSEFSHQKGDSEDNKEPSLLAGSGINNAKQMLEVPPEQALLEVPPGEALLEVPPGEALLEVPPGQASLEVPPGQALLEVPPGQASLEVPPGQALLEVPPGQASLEVPPVQALLEVPPGQASLEVPPGQASLEVPPGQALLEVPPGQAPLEIPPGEALLEVPPGQASLEVPPGQALLEVPPGQASLEVPPGQALLEVPPGQASLEVPPGQASLEVPPGQASLEVPPGQASLEVPPGQASLEVPPGQALLEVPPGQAFLEVPPGQATLEIPPGEALLEVPPGQASLEVLPGQALLEAPPGQALLEVPPGQASLEVPPGQALLEVPPGQALLEVSPGEASLEVPPGKALLEVPPGEALVGVRPGKESLEAKISEVDSALLVGRDDTIIDTDHLSCTTGIVGSNSETCKNLSSNSDLNTVASTSHSKFHQGVSKTSLQLPKSGIIKAELLLEKPTPEASSQGKSSEADHTQYHNDINMDTESQVLSNSEINDSKNILEAETSTGCNLESSLKEVHQTIPENTSVVNAEVMEVETSHPTTSCELTYKSTKLDSVDSEFDIHIKTPETRHPAEESKEPIQAELTRQETVSLVSHERKDKTGNDKDEELTTCNSSNQDQTGDVNKCTDSMGISKLSRSDRNFPSQTSKHFPSSSETTKKGEGLKVKQKKKRTKKLPVGKSRVKSKEAPTFKFQCICGEEEEELDYDLFYECLQCSGWQHKKCVDYRGISESECSLCPMCCVDHPAVPSGATLIVSPKPICHQWIDEINRHVHARTLKVLVYDGVKKHGFLHPRTLAKQDIVITTYDTLRSELNYVGLLQTNSQKGRRLRHAKRYMAVPSPLPAVEWWRVCLDEAQMVERPTAKTAEMALQLTAVNRWCVTGTPIQRDLSNLYGLFLFLGVEPYWVKCWWDNILYKPYLHGNQEPMEEALAKVLWRSAKKDVINQINIPAQTEETHWLNFSPIETHFYRRKHEDCSNHFLQVTGRLKVDVKTKLSALDRATVHKLMNPLLRLRQACCHPQAVRGEFVSMQRNTLTMAELLESLTLKAKVESEEAHRQLVCALNGLAAVCIIKGEMLDAIQHYREVLLSAEEHKDRLKTDSLQRLHAMHNLHQLLKLKPEGLIPTLRDGELDKQVQEIRDTYLAKAEAAVQSSLTSLLPLQEKITDLKHQLSSTAPWWVEGLQWVQYLGLDEEFIDKVKNALQSTASSDTLSVVNHFSTVRGLQMVLVTKIDDLTTAYQRLQTGMMRLNVEVTQELVSEATDCHLRPFGGKPKNRCPFCRVHTLFTEYETCLFSIKQRDTMADPDSEDDDSNVTGPRLLGSWAASEAERILRSLLAFLKHHGADEDVLQEGNNYVEMMDTQKKEFKSLRVTWTMLCERVAAWDELKMATMRLRLREAHEPDDVTSQPNVVEPNQLDQQRYKLLNDRVLAQSELKKKLGQLVYLRSLSSAQSDLPEGINPEPCPICVRELGKQWTVLPCGHSFCNSCMEMMRVHNSSRRKTIRCAICRSVSSTLEISFVSTEPTNQEEDCSINVRGGYSTKVEAVVRILLQLRNQDPHVKALIFSTWIDVLTVIAKSLKDNNIEYRSIGLFGDRHFKENLMDFKQEEGVTALLLPVHSGSKGLNIIEATHVLLVEPILNPASELQAVGRVHRIGQTRPTVVHRFLVRDTIEERLHAFLQAKHTSASLNNLEGETGALTLDTLKQLFTY